jgi:hypothetical protein
MFCLVQQNVLDPAACCGDDESVGESDAVRAEHGQVEVGSARRRHLKESVRVKCFEKVCTQKIIYFSFS